MNRYGLGLMTCVLALSGFATLAAAQEVLDESGGAPAEEPAGAEPAAPTPTTYASTEAGDGAVGGGARYHDGFYLQLTGGLGYVSSSLDTPADESIGGLAVDTSIMLGGSIIPGLAIGGGLMIDYLPSPGYSVGDMDIDGGPTSQYLVGIGAFGDFYPDPAGGLHFQAFIGWGGLESSYEGNVGGSDPTGLVITVAGGYDVFISDELSVGGMARIGYAPLSINDVSVTSIAPALLGTLTLH